MSDLSHRYENISASKKELAPRLEKMVAAYATVASAAAGVAMLSAPAAEAKIVFTPANKQVSSPVQIDLNHDGIADFEIEFCACLPHGQVLQVSLGVTGNMVQAVFGVEAAALQRGAPIGPKQSFTSVTSGYGGVFMADAGSYGTAVYSNGPWLNVTNRYLGLKFLINGQVHFGWARLTSTDRLRRVVLTGYAYETAPNTHLRAGQTSEAADDNTALLSDPLPQGPSLGTLARGADALEVWRRSPIAVPII
jgi:hypothetical protein